MIKKKKKKKKNQKTCMPHLLSNLSQALRQNFFQPYNLNGLYNSKEQNVLFKTLSEHLYINLLPHFVASLPLQCNHINMLITSPSWPKCNITLPFFLKSEFKYPTTTPPFMCFFWQYYVIHKPWAAQIKYSCQFINLGNNLELQNQYHLMQLFYISVSCNLNKHDHFFLSSTDLRPNPG